jgi:hypothetical protein
VTAMADFRLAPAGGRGPAGDVAPQLERAPPGRFLLERGACLLGRTRLFAGLGCRAVQRPFRLGFRGRRFRGLCRLRCLRRFRGGRLLRVRCRLRRGFLRFAFLLGLPLDRLFLFLLDLFLLPRDQFLGLALLGFAGGELLGRDQGNGRSRRRLFDDGAAWFRRA